MAPPPTLPAVFEQAQAQEGDHAPAQAADFAAFAAFGSPELAQLIAAANRDSPDLAVAVARVRQADARARQAGAALLPEVDANLDATQFGGGAHGTTAHETDWSALLSASYELDFWGRNRRHPRRRAGARQGQPCGSADRQDDAADIGRELVPADTIVARARRTRAFQSRDGALGAGRDPRAFRGGPAEPRGRRRAACAGRRRRIGDSNAAAAGSRGVGRIGRLGRQGRRRPLRWPPVRWQRWPSRT